MSAFAFFERGWRYIFICGSAAMVLRLGMLFFPSSLTVCLT